MSKDDTQLLLEMALQRILDGKTVRIPEQRKLSVRAAEEEADLGNGSSYYYPDFIDKVKAEKAKLQTKNTGEKPVSTLTKIREAKKNEVRIKEQYRNKIQRLQAEHEQMAAEHHQLSYALRKAHKQINKIERELEETKRQLIELRQDNIKAIK